MNLDSSFITNEGDNTLKKRLDTLFTDTQNFDVIVGYFYASGFHAIYKSLEATENIRILIGMNTNRKIAEAYQLAKKDSEEEDNFTPKNMRNNYAKTLIEELNNSPDTKDVENGIDTFIKWIKSGKLEMRVYPEHNIHAKVYIFTFNAKDRDKGRVITGSSNLTAAGLTTNFEFNVELEREKDYEFALSKFNELWEKSTSLENIAVDTIEKNTWLSTEITPYELYLKFLYEYFKKELSIQSKFKDVQLPKHFKKYKYQEDAVNFAIEKLLTHGGVFISDVVGLGKTYMTLMLLKQIGGNSLIIAPPNLVSRANPGSWEILKSEFGILADTYSYGLIKDILKERDHEQYTNLVVDEAHLFRSEGSQRYKALAEIAKGKKVILVSATPYNNNPRDIFNLLKLFQNPRRSTLQKVVNLENFFKKRMRKLEVYRHEEYNEQQAAMKEVSNEIRTQVLSELMLRRTRTEVDKYYKQDMIEQGLSFPKVQDSEQFYYLMNEKVGSLFNETVQNIGDLKLARYAANLYLTTSKADLDKPRGLIGFIKTTLIKRLESSFFAFKKSINKQVNIYRNFIKNFEEHKNVYVSPSHLEKVFELIENEQEDKLVEFMEEGKTHRHAANEFKPEFIKELKDDLKILEKIQSKWEDIEEDPKLKKLIHELKHNEVLNNNENKIIIFSEAVDTAKYLEKLISVELDTKVLLFTGSSSKHIRNEVLDNFDANIENKQQKDDYRILVATEALSEGVNLHRACIVINYDIPWNPTRIMQRVGRVNRVNTTQKNIYTYTFLPSDELESQILIKQRAEEKLAMFLNILGEDMIYLTEAPSSTSHELFEDITNPTDIAETEVDSTFNYLMEIKSVKDNKKELFERIKAFPLKARVAKKIKSKEDAGLITFFRKGFRTRIIRANTKLNQGGDFEFLNAAKLIKSTPQEKAGILSNDYYNLLDKNKGYYKEVEERYQFEYNRISLNRTEQAVIRHIEIIRTLTNKLVKEDAEFLNFVYQLIYYAGLPKHITESIYKKLKDIDSTYENISTTIDLFNSMIPRNFLLARTINYEDEKNLIPEVVLSFELTNN